MSSKQEIHRSHCYGYVSVVLLALAIQDLSLLCASQHLSKNTVQNSGEVPLHLRDVSGVRHSGLAVHCGEWVDTGEVFLASSCSLTPSIRQLTAGNCSPNPGKCSPPSMYGPGQIPGGVSGVRIKRFGRERRVRPNY
ncbi:hypothetical protein DPEC_G00328200 [Dallia pectoralis]|uniref:Uncharacterized protein n=1 Tax=Dallia pectoralis TaxID=75939 RepID=A0ACC2F8E3_DALPE|nr:hypothetical protein DPEC_G00328200 [Dallia pectoralis]